MKGVTLQFNTRKVSLKTKATNNNIIRHKINCLNNFCASFITENGMLTTLVKVLIKLENFGVWQDNMV